jgi:FkbM family methyltransferase
MTSLSKSKKIFSLNFVRKIFKLFLFERIISLLSQNKDLNSFIGKLIPENNLYPPGSIRNAKRNGIRYLLDLSDYQNWLIYFGLNDDRPQGLYELIKTNYVIIDVGANIGQTSMNFAKSGGENSVIYAFEPDPVNYSKAIENLKLNSFNNIHYFNIGLGSASEKLSLKINSPLNRGGNRIDRNSGNSSLIITIDTLDNILEKENVKKVDLIKIDVEGFELEVLKGARHTITQYKPVLFIEIDDNNLKQQGTGADELIRFITELGYKCVGSKSKNEINVSEMNLKNCHFDMICVPN